MQNERNIPYTNLRDWLEEAEKLGEVRYVEGASWERDIGMATEVVQHDEKAYSVRFDLNSHISIRSIGRVEAGFGLGPGIPGTAQHRAKQEKQQHQANGPRAEPEVY